MVVGHKVDIEESGIKDTESGAPPDPNARLIEITSGLAFPLADSRDTTVGRLPRRAQTGGPAAPGICPA